MRKSILIACCWMMWVLPAPAQRSGRQPRPGPENLPETNPYSSAADVEAGRRLYAGKCGHCHGQSGEGGRGAVLNTGRYRHGSSDRDLFLIIRDGIPDTEMPGTFRISDAEIWRMAAYVRELGRQGAQDPTPGDATAGALIYQEDGCALCHTIGGQGGFLGPELTDIGAKRAARHLRESILQPGTDIPLEYRTVVVIPVTGMSTRGIHLNEDEYSIHLRDLSGNLRSFLKSEIKEIKLPRESLMPAYTSLSKTDLENLVAYLSSLRPRRAGAAIAKPAEAEVWTFDRLENIGGHGTSVQGQPKVIDSPVGKAVEFDGVDDALFIDNHPLAGAEMFTWEAIFRPDGGETEQRWFHLSERDPNNGADTDNRMLFEIRVTGDQWCLDSYHQSGTESKALLNRKALHPLGAWYHVATVYDGQELRNYVDGVQQGAAQLHLAPHGPGRTSVGARINRVFYFKGAVRLSRFTRKALSPSEFLTLPPKP